MKTEEMRDLDDTELRVKEQDLREQIFRLRFQLGMGQTDSLKKYRALKKDLARVLTLKSERAESAQG